MVQFIIYCDFDHTKNLIEKTVIECIVAVNTCI